MSSLIIVTLLLSIFPLVSFGQSLSFSLPTTDGLSNINGQIDYPTTCERDKSPAALIVGGTGVFYWNGYFGRSGTRRDFIFEDLSNRLAEKCIATVRFDYRGISCDITSAEDLDICIDEEARATVSDQTKLDDIEAVYQFAMRQPQIDSSKFLMIGHSEGSLNISRLIADNRVSPKALLFFGGLTESAKSILHWQIVDRSVAMAFEMDTNDDSILTNEEIRENYSRSGFNGVVPVESLLSPTGFWTHKSLYGQFQASYDQIKNMALSKPDEEPYYQGSKVFTSYAWWKRWFTDDVSVVENLANFSGEIIYYNGTIDSQTPGERQKQFLEENLDLLDVVPSFNLIEEKGHGLGSHPLYGPIDEGVVDEVVESAASALQ